MLHPFYTLQQWQLLSVRAISAADWHHSLDWRAIQRGVHFRRNLGMLDVRMH